MCWHFPIFPGGRPPSIFGTNELNYRVRNGNGWTLIVIDTNYITYYTLFNENMQVSFLVTRTRFELVLPA